jgi:NodT family efflux transporter outer membrane factor (OMF) lipoprotein
VRNEKAVAPILLLVAVVVMGKGCTLHRAEVQPQPLFAVPDSYSLGDAAAVPEVDAWWLAFDDPALDELVGTALSDNFTLAQGLTRIERAMALRRQVQSLRRPQVNLTGDVERRWTRDLDPPRPSRDTSVNIPPIVLEPEPAEKQLSGGGVSGGGGSQGQPDRDQWETQASVGLGLRWELDLWGRLRALAQAQREEVAAAVEDYHALRLALSAQVAQAYYEAVEQRLQLALLEDQLELANTFLELLELRFIQADASAVDLLQQRSQVAEIEAEMPVAQAQLRLLENRLDVLLGAPPDGVDRTADNVASLPRDTVLPAVEVPLALLQRRPDLQALQRRVVAEDYRVGAAIAERLPQVTLDGRFAFNDTSTRSNLVGSSGLALFQPLLDWGRRAAEVSAAQAVLQQALLVFSHEYLLAIEEVETTLWQETRQRELIDALARREDLLVRTVEEARVRYSLGVTDYLPVLTALQELQRVQRRLLTQRRVLVALRIQLYRATGGGTDAGR